MRISSDKTYTVPKEVLNQAVLRKEFGGKIWEDKFKTSSGEGFVGLEWECLPPIGSIERSSLGASVSRHFHNIRLGYSGVTFCFNEEQRERLELENIPAYISLDNFQATSVCVEPVIQEAVTVSRWFNYDIDGSARDIWSFLDRTERYLDVLLNDFTSGKTPELDGKTRQILNSISFDDSELSEEDIEEWAQKIADDVTNIEE